MSARKKGDVNISGLSENPESLAWPDSAPPCLLRPSLFSCPFGLSFHHHQEGRLEGLTQATQDVSLFLKGDEREQAPSWKDFSALSPWDNLCDKHLGGKPAGGD